MTSALLAGIVFGVGALLVLRSLFPPRVPLAVALERLEHRRPAEAVAGPSQVPGDLGALQARLGRWVAVVLQGLGLRLSSLRSDLAAVGRPMERHMAEKAALALFGGLLGPATAALMALGGVSVPVFLPVWASLALAAGGFFVPDLTLRSEAADRRRSFRHALGSFLDLVVISLAGGGGVEAALTDASEVGGGWAFVELRRALASARLARETPWAALGRLGERLGVAELVELAASVGLAGTEGAKVRDSLVAKARSLRSHELAAAESEAQAMTEKMSLPVVLLFVGFIVFIGYPAVTRVLSGI